MKANESIVRPKASRKKPQLKRRGMPHVYVSGLARLIGPRRIFIHWTLEIVDDELNDAKHVVKDAEKVDAIAERDTCYMKDVCVCILQLSSSV